MPKFIIIGGGIAGLTAAFRLHQKGCDVSLLEAKDRVGGCIHSMHQDDYLLELGPNTLLSSHESLWNLVSDLGLDDSRLEVDPQTASVRYIFKKGKLKRVAPGPQLMLGNLLSLRGRLRLLGELFIKSQSNQDDESLASFVTRRAGKEVLDTLVTPMVSGVYAGDPETLSVKSIFPKLVEWEVKYGSLFKALKKEKGALKGGHMVSFKEGIGSLPQKISQILGSQIIKEALVQKIQKVDEEWKIDFDHVGKKQSIEADCVIVATPAYHTATLLADLLPKSFMSLNNIPYTSLSVGHVVFNKKDVPHSLNGFGFLIPRGQGVRMLGSIWSSSLFPNRAPVDKCLLTNFVGGALDPDALKLTDNQIASVILKDLKTTLGITKEPIMMRVTRYRQAIPQYTIGHAKRLHQIETELKTVKGLYLTGSYFTGVSVTDTIEHARNIVQNLLTQGVF